MSTPDQNNGHPSEPGSSPWDIPASSTPPLPPAGPPPPVFEPTMMLPDVPHGAEGPQGSDVDPTVLLRGTEDTRFDSYPRSLPAPPPTPASTSQYQQHQPMPGGPRGSAGFGG